MRLRNWTPFVFLRPDRYLSDAVAASFDIERWSDEVYTWDQDPWNGLLDFAQAPVETIEKGHGDCEDYALVAASHERARNQWRDKPRDISLVFLFPKWLDGNGHVVAVARRADYTRIYSSGEILEGVTLDEYVDESEYHWALERQVA